MLPRVATRFALFDMDRTLVRVDTATLYVRYQRKLGEIKTRDSMRLAWWLLRYTFGMLDPATVADKALRAYRGKPERWMIERCDTWFDEYVVPHVADAGKRAVKAHLEQGHVGAIVTGATPYAARPLARLLGIEHVVCTELEVDAAGRFTGRARPPLCFGNGKLARAESFVGAAGGSLKEAVFYTDSITDLPLLDQVGERVAVNPDPRLRRVAERRGWPVQRW